MDKKYLADDNLLITWKEFASEQVGGLFFCRIRPDNNGVFPGPSPYRHWSDEFANLKLDKGICVNFNQHRPR